ncbi:MAG: DUF3822 family protein [Bacteroidaceae bacterium]|nr:DUF3822 family protein [Bacteroidaceae bacterium]
MTEVDFSKSEQYTLSIRLSADGFSFSIYHPQLESDFTFISYQVNASYSLTANLKEFIGTTEAFKYSYKKTNILIDTPRFTLVPFDLFEDDHQDDIFHYNFPPKDNEIILCNILGKSNVALLFGVNKHSHLLLNEHFPTARIFSCISPLAEHFALKSKEGNCRKLYAHFRNDQLETFVFDKGKLLLCNSFQCKKTADKVYYLLYIWQQQGLSQERDQLHLAGNIQQKEELMVELHKFLRNVFIIPKQEIPFDIQTLLTCE